MKKVEIKKELAGKEITLTTGHVAEQATTSCIAQIGETVCLATIVAAPLREDRGYFPLSVEYMEKLYAGGIIKGSRWVKRDGKPTDDEILTARVIDRSIRPLFPKEYVKDVQVVVTVLSVDLENPPDMVGAIAVSAALSASSIPFNGPLGILRVANGENGYIVNPTNAEIESSNLDLIVSSTQNAIVMIESGADEVPEEDLLSAIEYSHNENQKLINIIEEFAAKVGAKKESVEKEKLSESVVSNVKKIAGDSITKLAMQMAVKEAGYAEYDELKASVVDQFEEDGDKKDAAKVFDKIFSDVVREKILSGTRIDGRKTDELRALSAEVGFLPRTHGSGLFHRGQTQALTIATLGSSSLEQLIETAEGEETKRYIHHYEMPPYSVGETGRMGYPKRREIGHGALAERALMPVIPSAKEFPYTIRVVTQILSSNGSTSMASVCGSTLSLMDAGVPIKEPVAGIAMGVVIETDKNYKVLTDIVGIEDGSGDMDFKVAGTKNGITALQLDVKTTKLTVEILKAALSQARGARMQILEVMNACIDTPRESVSAHAPKIKTLSINKEKIGELIGPGGKTIKGISAQFEVEVNVDDDGAVSISGVNNESVEKAFTYVEGLTKEVQPNEIYEGTVTRVENYGAFVEILPQKQGLVHVSDMSVDYVKDPSDVLEIGQSVQVRVKEVDDFNRINLSMILDPKDEDPSSKEKEHKREHGGGRRNDRGNRRSFSRSRNNNGGNKRYSRGNNNRDRNSKKSSGPHFPASRLLDMDDKRSRR